MPVIAYLMDFSSLGKHKKKERGKRFHLVSFFPVEKEREKKERKKETLLTQLQDGEVT
jgi:hypothetical protein